MRNKYYGNGRQVQYHGRGLKIRHCRVGGKGYVVGRGQDDEVNWEDYNINIIDEAEKAGVPVPTELSIVNSVYDIFGQKAPQVNKQSGAIRPAPSLFSFLNFNI